MWARTAVTESCFPTALAKLLFHSYYVLALSGIVGIAAGGKLCLLLYEALATRLVTFLHTVCREAW